MLKIESIQRTPGRDANFYVHLSGGRTLRVPEFVLLDPERLQAECQQQTGQHFHEAAEFDDPRLRADAWQRFLESELDKPRVAIARDTPPPTPKRTRATIMLLESCEIGNGRRDAGTVLGEVVTTAGVELCEIRNGFANPHLVKFDTVEETATDSMPCGGPTK